MRRTTKLLAIIAAVAISLLWSKYPDENTGKLKYADTTIIKGNTTLDGNTELIAGLISPGNSPGKITVTGDFTMGSSATYKCELKDLSGAGTGHDQIDVSGNITLDGTLEVVLDGYTPNDSDHFDIIAYGGTVSGTFSITGLPAGWDIDYGLITANTITLYGPASALPIELLNFNATKKQDRIAVSWQTTSEQNSDYFDIEHSNDARYFQKLGSTKAQGTSYEVRNYTYTHQSPSKGINYYRLKQVDMDGKFTYSNIVSAKIGKEEISFYPNPATGTISFNRPVETVTIYDLMGKEVLKKKQVESVL
ncbi:MAG TPA: hypothetical protein ENK85_09680, partial [Saprospiraceae bacterium]|nr:hypothetical protein [Saprospiraceae bacterium]